MIQDLFSDSTEQLDDGAWLLRGFALEKAVPLIAAIEAVAKAAPFRHLVTPGGFRMSVAMTNCGAYGWVSDRRGYRYDAVDPDTGRAWPAMPSSFLDLGREAAQAAGYAQFNPDVCLVNRYTPGTRLTLHQDRDEGDFAHPIVSISLGVPATFLWGGLARGDKTRRYALYHGDVVVWGGPSRLRFHGIAPLKSADHPLTGNLRFNLTFRRQGS
ncbi:DNA oxidative demethylase AlkB [Dongia rigui]|uniref:DNA oxidative demethylase AlkB n=1 Tax=Dongia rigui TaxID=940149 RepID=A0ABU5DXD8_9PROT|nr:DNA oxidative demethylase AlkB [Dongia rigui]MDY0871672.1 DNA oxidative demethylase AlkB [Dongia rigui]